MSSTVFWSQNQVGGPYFSLEESLAALEEREALYPTLSQLMPTIFPDQTVLDYGCGPGHDTILFAEHGAGHVFYYDISSLALEIVDERLELHGLADRASPANRGRIPKVDHAHCAGVLHHTEDPLGCLKDIRAALKPTGDVNVMIYDGDTSKHTKSKVPITMWWTSQEFTYLAYQAGFNCQRLGTYECSAPWRPDCFAACYHLTPHR